jgi:hypothetical protein
MTPALVAVISAAQANPANSVMASIVSPAINVLFMNLKPP